MTRGSLVSRHAQMRAVHPSWSLASMLTSRCEPHSMQSGAQPQARYHTQAAHLQQLLQACTCQVLPVPLVSRYAHFQQARLGAEKSSAKSQHRNEHALPQ